MAEEEPKGGAIEQFSSFGIGVEERNIFSFL
jgi:hypothetical protein